MKIYLFLDLKLLTFTIPQKVSGSFSFDENPEEEAKLINIKAQNNEWYIYSTTDVSVLSGSAVTNHLVLQNEKYYVIRRNGIDYTIYVTNTFDNTFLPYSYNQDINLVIGNGQDCNISFNCPYIKGAIANVYIDNGNMLLYVRNERIYYNNVHLGISENPYVINSGDKLNIYGLKIVFLKGFLLINNPANSVKCDSTSNHLSQYKIEYGSTPIDVEVKDTDLYSKEQYFSKAPRIRRLIKTKEITLSPPPKQDKEDHMPMILTVGPMITMGLASGILFVNNISKLMVGGATLKSSWPTMATSLAMLVSTLLWPSLTKVFNGKLKKLKKKELIDKYTAYLDEKRNELSIEAGLQKEILIENLLSVDQCLNIINVGKINFWDKRIDQNDFLDVRIGIGDALLDAKVNYPEEGFTIEEDELRKKADEMVESFKYIREVPVGYSLYNNKITAIMGERYKCYGMINNIILQLITFYSYEDIKIVVFTNNINEDNWQYVKYLNHCLSNDKSIRFYSSNIDSAKKIGDYLNYELQNRIQLVGDGTKLFKPYYIIITDDFSKIKGHNFIKSLTESDINLGFSLILLENQMSLLPSKCNNFINLGQTTSGILKDSFESQEQIIFKDEIYYGINMMDVARKLSNIPIEFEEGNKQIPDSVTFLEMEKVGMVEQLNIMNRWDSNDSTASLKTEVGIDVDGNLMYLDLHEKYHGPHGLIAGMTGSGKSEFIITYILSMAINYSPDDVAFILIDYKGGGLAGAFENKATGVYLPHLAGVITNLDKAEMDRTLVSIDSEIKRRQQIFNMARDGLGESTIDIYKYQRFYKEGKLKEPIPHLFIICDEFAELKSQQPDFMDSLLSVARIGRSLGVHLILATQKPSGVVNDQIWSNTKFRICLKVQDESDSKEMLKRPEAASLKNVGRFYLQVGYDEYFALGQSAWCGAKYYPSEKIIKQVDKSINFIDDTGNIIKSIKSGNNIKLEAKGEQLAAILNDVIETAKASNKRAKRLWLNDIEPIILVDNLEKKYGFTQKPYEISAIVGEYDAPEKQEQGLLIYSLEKDGNTIIYGNEEVERENFLNAVVYSMCRWHTSKELNIYIADFGSEQFHIFNGFPQVGGMAFLGEDEKFKNLFKLISDEIKERKKLLANYGASIDLYNSKNETKLPRILFILNNYDSIIETYNSIYEDVTTIARDCERYGIVMMITCNNPAIIGRRVSQCFNTKYTMHLTDPSDYYGAFNVKITVKPKDTVGRGLANNDGIHEFQTASIVPLEQNLNEFLSQVAAKIRQVDHEFAPSIPSLPDRVTFDIIEKHISTIKKVPIGISKETLKPIRYDFTAYASTLIASNKLTNINSFMDSLLDILVRIQGLTVFFIDTLKLLPSASSKSFNNNKVNYYDSNFDSVIDKIIELEKNPDNSKYQILYIIYGLEKFKQKVTLSKIEEMFNEIKVTENSTMILCDSTKAFKLLDFETWFSKVKNNTDGIWIGKGFGEQQNFRISKITKEMSLSYTNDYGFCLTESSAELMKVIQFNDEIRTEDDDDEE